MHNELIELLYLNGMSKKALIKYINVSNYDAFRYACRKGHLEVAKFLLEQGFVKQQIEAWNYCAFRSACENGHLEVVKLLLKQGFVKEQMEACEYWAFSLACYDGHLEVAKFLLKQGFVEEQIKALREHENSFHKIKYKDLVEKGIVNV